MSSHSPSYYAWLRFRRNRLAFLGFLFILLCTLIAVLGYSILPDNTVNSNRQDLSLETLAPGTRVQILRIYTSPAFRREFSVPGIFWSGQQQNYKEIALSKYHYSGDSLQFIPFGEKRQQSLSLRELKNANYEVFERTYVLGTDRFGRDMLSRLLLGARVSLAVGFISVSISLLVGMILGSLAGFFGGKADVFIRWLINVVWSIPTFLFVMALALVLGRGFWQVFVAVGLTMWVEVARLVRGQVLGLREQEYVQAANALGFRKPRIILIHIIPNMLGPLMVIASANFASAILLEAGLSFLGLGVQPPSPSWGVMINEHFSYIVQDAAFLAILPGFAIAILVLSFNLLGNGLRDALDVRLK